jgi:hypothetical protein
MSRRDRQRRPARRAPYRDPRPRILIVCEGVATERDYFDGFRRSSRNQLVEVEIARKGGDPDFIVRRAKALREEADGAARRERDDFLRYEQVWCVFDRDEHSHFDSAVGMARDNGIEVAASVPCFELWLLLHFREQPGAQNRHAMQALMKTIVTGFEKHLDFSEFEPGYDDAVRRARKLEEDARAAGEPFRNPSTGVQAH